MNPVLCGDLSVQLLCAVAPSADASTSKSEKSVERGDFMSTPIAALNLMSMTKVKASLLSAILVAGLATPLVIRHQARVNLREKGEASQQQPNDELTYLRAENEKLSNLVAQANSSQSLSKDQLSELLKLRAEVSRLRGDSQELARLKAAKEGTDQGSQLIRVTPFPPGGHGRQGLGAHADETQSYV